MHSKDPVSLFPPSEPPEFELYPPRAGAPCSELAELEFELLPSILPSWSLCFFFFLDDFLFLVDFLLDDGCLSSPSVMVSIILLESEFSPKTTRSLSLDALDGLDRFALLGLCAEEGRLGNGWEDR